MRVNDPNSRDVGQTGLSNAGLNKTQETTRVERSSGFSGTTKAGRQDDRVQLSNLGSQLQAEESNSPERAAKIDKLRSEVGGGQYRLDAGKVASKIVDDVIDHQH